MNNWMLCTVRYTKQNQDNGTFKRVNEKYLFAAMTFGDAENRVYEELGEQIRGEFSVTAIATKDLNDIFSYEKDTWYECKITYGSEDIDTGKSKKVTNSFLVSADTVKEATEYLQESLKGMMADYEVVSVVKSPILDIFPFKEDTEISARPELVEENN